MQASKPSTLLEVLLLKLFASGRGKMVRLVRALKVKRQSTFQLRESLGVLDAGHYRLDSGFGSLSALPFAGRLLLPALPVRILHLRQPAASHHTRPSHPFRKSY
jgi:hypothetical protein